MYHGSKNRTTTPNTSSSPNTSTSTNATKSTPTNMSEPNQHILQCMVDKVLQSPSYIDQVDLSELKWIKHENGGFRLSVQNDVDFELYIIYVRDIFIYFIY